MRSSILIFEQSWCKVPSEIDPNGFDQDALQELRVLRALWSAPSYAVSADDSSSPSSQNSPSSQGSNSAPSSIWIPDGIHSQKWTR